MSTQTPKKRIHEPKWKVKPKYRVAQLAHNLLKYNDTPYNIGYGVGMVSGVHYYWCAAKKNKVEINPYPPETEEHKQFRKGFLKAKPRYSVD